MLRLAEIPYLNCYPFYWNRNIRNGKIVWVRASPKKLGAMAKKKKIDAGPISLVDSFLIEKDFEPLGNFGIAVKNLAKSVLLFSKNPIHSLQGHTIGLTSDSVTSIKLLQFLIKKRYRLKVKYRVGFKDSDDAQIYIGDLALKKFAEHSKKLSKRFPYVTDLGEEWQTWKKLPFVFARWMVRKDLPNEEKNLLAKWLNQNIITAPNLKNSSQQTYLDGFCYRLGPKELKAIQTFRNLLEN